MSFPRELSSYIEPAGAGVWEAIRARAEAEPFNVVVTFIFALAVLHTFFCPKFMHAAHAAEKGSRRARLFHLLGEVELVFVLWAVVLAVTVIGSRSCAPCRPHSPSAACPCSA